MYDIFSSECFIFILLRLVVMYHVSPSPNQHTFISCSGKVICVRNKTCVISLLLKET